MSPQYILRKSLCRAAHCFSAHVPGQGYVNRGDLAETRAEYDRQRRRSAEQEIENLGFAAGYAEPGYSDPERGVLFANWNVFSNDVCNVLERAGFAIEWSDEWSTCEDCGKAVRTSPNGWDWHPHYREDGIENGSFVCLDCAPYPECSTCGTQTDAEHIYNGEYCSQDCYDNQGADADEQVSE